MGLRGAVMAGVAALVVGAAGAQAKWVAAPGSPYSAGNEPYSVNPGLFNGDARLDLAVINGSSSNVHVFLQQAANGGFALSASSPFNVGSGPNFAGVADYNGDGRQDLAVANFLSNTVSVMLQQADGSFSQEETLNVGDQVGAVAAGDFNGDGRADVVASRWNGGSLQVFFRKGTNDGFTAPQTVGSGTNPRYIAAGDLNGGAPDLVVANAGGDTLSVLLNDGGGSFTQASGTPLIAGHTPQAAVIADLNNDGRGDIAGSSFDGKVSVYAQQGDGTFAAVSGSPYDLGGQAQGIAAADFRAIGRNDLAVAVAGTHSVAILRNDGGTFTHSEDIPLPVGDGAFGLAAGPFNDSDSVPDVAVSSVTAASADPLDVFFNFQPPQATTTDATAVAGTSATLNAVVNPLGSDTDAHFEYGTSTAYGSLAPAGGELAAGSDGTQHTVSRFIGELALNTTYHYRVVASNTGGTTVGEDKTFTTLAVPPDSQLSGPPQAFLSAPSTVAVGTPTTLSAEGSTPAAGLQYALDLDGSGQFATDLKTQKTLQTTFTVPGDVKVGLRVTDAAGRTDEVRRTVHVTSPKLYDVRVSPSEPRPGQRVTFKVRELLDSPAKEAAILKPLSAGTLATATFGDGRTPSSLAAGLLIRDRAASTTGTFT